MTSELVQMEAVWFLVDPAEPQDLYAVIANSGQAPREEQKE